MWSLFEKIQKFLGGILNQVLFRIPAMQRNLALPSDNLFGKLVTNLFNRHNKPANQEILTDMLEKEPSEFPNNSKCLELGFGPGYAMKTILQKYPNFSTLEGVDPSLEMHAVCKENLKERPTDSCSKINLKEGHGDNKPHVSDESIGFLFHSNVVYFWNDMDQTLKELGRVLKPDSGLMASMTSLTIVGGPAFDRNIFKNTSQQDYVESLQRNGFEVVRMEGVGSTEYECPPEMILVKKKAT